MLLHQLEPNVDLYSATIEVKVEEILSSAHEPGLSLDARTWNVSWFHESVSGI